jgi:hypothetical protein
VRSCGSREESGHGFGALGLVSLSTATSTTSRFLTASEPGLANDHACADAVILSRRFGCRSQIRHLVERDGNPALQRALYWEAVA